MIIAEFPRDHIFPRNELVFSTYYDNFNNKVIRIVHLPTGYSAWCDNVTCALDNLKGKIFKHKMIISEGEI